MQPFVNLKFPLPTHHFYQLSCLVGSSLLQVGNLVSWQDSQLPDPLFAVLKHYFRTERELKIESPSSEAVLCYPGNDCYRFFMGSPDAGFAPQSSWGEYCSFSSFADEDVQDRQEY